MRFRITVPAERDLAEIGDYIALDNKARARSFIAEIEARFVEIAKQPTLYRLRDEIMPGFRAAAHGRYLIYFRCDDSEVVFMRVLHGARNQSDTLAEP
ncbi:MAG: type II toxin-antitoxin system RelE/ParE family toxin [Sphingomonas sp.]|jgi:toxin ParE1/3/4